MVKMQGGYERAASAAGGGTNSGEDGRAPRRVSIGRLLCRKQSKPLFNFRLHPASKQ